MHDGTAPTGTHGVTPSQSWILCILHRQCQLNASWYFVVTLARKTHEIIVFNRISFYFTHFDTSSKQHSDLFFLYTSSVLSRSCVREFRSTRETRRNVSLTWWWLQRLKRRLQLRLDYDSTAIRPRYDRSTTYVTTVTTSCGLLHCGPYK